MPVLRLGAWEGPLDLLLELARAGRIDLARLSAVELVAVEPTRLRVRGIDLLDGTPVVDIKPYVPYADAFPDAAAGWIDAIDADHGLHSAPGPRRPRR